MVKTRDSIMASAEKQMRANLQLLWSCDVQLSGYAEMLPGMWDLHGGS